MKKISVFLFILPLAFAGCKKNLDLSPEYSPTNGNFYSSQAEILMAVNACYPYVGARANHWPGIPTQLMTDNVTDIAATRLTLVIYSTFKTGTVNSNQTIATYWWENCYDGINRTCALLDNMHRAEAVTDPTLFKRVKAEARAIRALMYLYLVQNYGDVPLVTKVLTVAEGLEITRNPKAEVYQFIYSELDAAAPDLPTKYTTAGDVGRITRGAALAIKARAALYNGDWTIAKAAAKACMDLNEYRLFSGYREQFLYKNQNNSEVILYDQYMAVNRTTSFHQYNAPRNSKGQSQSFPTEDFVAGVECTDGKLITESPLYNPANPFANRDPRLAGAVLLPRVWDGTAISTNGGKFNGIEFMSSKEVLFNPGTTTTSPNSLSVKENKVLDEKSGKMITNQEVTNLYSSFTGYVMNKYLDSMWIDNNEKNFSNYVLIRYPEVLLTYVEASVELGQIDQSVLDALNTIRARAYGNTNASGVTDINAINYPKITTMNQVELRKIVRRERKVELCFEGFRLQDLRRWGLLEKALSGRKNYGRPENFSVLGPTDIPTIDGDELMKFPYATDKYGPNNEQNKLRYFETFGVIPAAYNLLPIPLGEIQLNPKLSQNSGYN